MLVVLLLRRKQCNNAITQPRVSKRQWYDRSGTKSSESSTDSTGGRLEIFNYLLGPVFRLKISGCFY